MNEGQMADPYQVFVVLDRSFRDRLADLARNGPVWIVDTPANRAAADVFWAANSDRTHLNGVTTFRFDLGATAENILVSKLDTIDLHHGDIPLIRRTPC